MNIDFHYYGTYYAARIAGFEKEDAEIIAWAAQAVDDCSVKNKAAYKDTVFKKLGDKVVYTCEETWEMFKDDFSWARFEDNETLRKVRSIWIPFHFLPGNIDKRVIKNYNSETCKSTDLNRLNKEISLICLPLSPQSEKMVERIKDNHSSDPFSTSSLVGIGIAMHVLADTWAHEFFAGTPAYGVNGVYDLNVRTNTVDKNEIPEDIDSKRSIGALYYSMGFLGHGRIGHYPDSAYCDFTYQPVWMKGYKITLTDGKGEKFFDTIHKEGRLEHKAAFINMVIALQAIYEDADYKVKLNNLVCKFQNGYTDIQELYACELDLANSEYVAESKDINANLEKVFSTNKYDQSEKWIEVLKTAEFQKKKLDEPEPYKFKEHEEWMEEFQKRAKEHQDWIMSYLEKKDLIPKYLTKK